MPERPNLIDEIGWLTVSDGTLRSLINVIIGAVARLSGAATEAEYYA